MIKEQAIDTLTLGNVSVTETDYCGGKVAVMASDGIDHWCDLCGKVEYACTHDHQYAYDTDARLYGTDAETGKRRQLTPEEAYWYIYDGQSDEFGNVGENARTPEVRIEGVVRGTHRGKELNMKLPKSMSKYADRIEQIWSEGEDGYWVDYKPGWCSGALGTPDLGHSPARCVHTEHEWSKRELWEAVSASEPCDCEECKNRKREEKR